MSNFEQIKPATKLSVMQALETIFNFFALNVALLIVCLPVVTAPVGLRAATVALQRWRDDRYVHPIGAFFRALRSRPVLLPWITVAGPLLAGTVAFMELRYFAGLSGAMDAMCLGLSVAGLLLALAALGYVLALVVTQPQLRPTETWRLAVVYVARNVVTYSALLVIETGACALLVIADPSLAVIGVPLLAVWMMRATAMRGIAAAEGSVPLPASWQTDTFERNVEEDTTL